MPGQVFGRCGWRNLRLDEAWCSCGRVVVGRPELSKCEYREGADWAVSGSCVWRVTLAGCGWSSLSDHAGQQLRVVINMACGPICRWERVPPVVNDCSACAGYLQVSSGWDPLQASQVVMMMRSVIVFV